LVAFLFFLATERLEFTRTLLETNVNNRGYKLGKFINNLSKSGEKIFVGSDSFKEFQEVFIGYYADRQVDYGEKDIIDKFKYKLIIRPKEHDALKGEIKRDLDKTFVRQENNDYIWYDTSDIKDL
jgi:hypothetical protein